jgi:hypothetical protein
MSERLTLPKDFSESKMLGRFGGVGIGSAAAPHLTAAALLRQHHAGVAVDVEPHTGVTLWMVEL